MVLTLYKYDASPSARAVMMTAEILGLKYHTIEVNTPAGDQLKPEYVKKNPTHTVPLLEDGEFTLADSHAIISYLVSKYGKEEHANLYPEDVQVRATINQRMYLEATLIFQRIRDIVIPILFKHAIGPSQQQIAEVNEVYGFLEKYLEKSTFLACDHVTLADISCVSSISSINTFVPVGDEFLRLRMWWDKLKTQDWYQKANLKGEKEFEEFWQKLMKDNRIAKN